MESNHSHGIESAAALNKHEHIFLPPHLVQLVVQIAKLFELASIDEFSLMDTLRVGIVKNLEMFNENLDDKKSCIFLVNVIRLSEKKNKAKSQLTKIKIDSIFNHLGITNEEFNTEEFTVFKLLNFKIEEPVVAETIYHLIDVHLPHMKKDLLYEFALDILRMAYFLRSRIYEMFTKDVEDYTAENLKQDQLLFGSAIFNAMIKFLCVSDRLHNEVFDKIAAQIKQVDAAKLLNELSAVIFNLVRSEESLNI